MQKKFGLYDPGFEHGSCGTGFVTSISGRASHSIIKDGFKILKNLVHRGAVGGDLVSGDGAGMLTSLPHEFFSSQGLSLPEPGAYGVAFLFLPQDKARRTGLMSSFRSVISREGFSLLGEREVPNCPEILGDISRSAMPYMKQVFLSLPGAEGRELELRLYTTRRAAEKKARTGNIPPEDFYIASMSSKTVVYKGMFSAPQFRDFYPDLDEREFKSHFAVVHQRYSTNTFPSWPLAQPFRYVAHNGEINTVRGNINYMRAREGSLETPLFKGGVGKVLPVFDEGGSDSAAFDSVYELLYMAGRSPEHTVMMLVPEAFGTRYHISADKRAFYEYHAAFQEPWDGPAALVFTDGVKVGAVLDRNGLRPARYIITRSGKMVLASEAGVLNIPASDVLEKGRLGPGRMIIADPGEKRVKKDNEIKSAVSRRRPYRRWLEDNRIELKGLFQPPGRPDTDVSTLTPRQRAFGYTQEELEKVILPMAENAQEPVGSMGNDEAPAVLSESPSSLFEYFKQVFAQVTNPPIDPYRENLVMSLMSFIGRERNLLDETPRHCRQLKLSHPVLTNEDIDRLLSFSTDDLRSCRAEMLFNRDGIGLEKAVEELCLRVEKSVDEGCSIVILSDRGIGPGKVPVPSLLGVSAVNSYLISRRKRHLVGLVVETGEAKEVMDFAALTGYGASAVNPYLVFETLAGLKKEGRLSEASSVTAAENYITAIKKGLLKVMSKMGVSTIRSYKGAQIFEAVGLNGEFLDRYFPGTRSRIGGIGIKEVEKETLLRHSAAFGAPGDAGLDSGGKYHYRKKSRKHLLTPEAVVSLQKAVREGDYGAYREYSARIDSASRELCTFRGLLGFNGASPVPLSEVESAENIFKRFFASAMSLGSISPEAHEAIAVAMNRIGAGSNSGEGGEEESRSLPLPSGDSASSAVKQVASGRFGVTAFYLSSAGEIQIKMAQGAKPGEGGQLPGHKVDSGIARVRHSTPGVMLISPPPHHDIYSIEDLSQLIYDLNTVNPEARVSVKLVSESGVGTVAAGVAKAGADMVLISGADGGTGAAPLSSIKHAGIPWELGLSETQQTLVLNDLREKIRVQVDGQMRTGRDVVIAALLGAEEFGFGTVVLVALGCVMARKCHQNTCPVGVATQDIRLRRRFRGRPEDVVNYFTFLAREVREIMASLGFRSFDEMVGKTERLEFLKADAHWKAAGLDLSDMLAAPNYSGSRRSLPRKRGDRPGKLDKKILKSAAGTVNNGDPAELEFPIKNPDRSVGALLSGRIAGKYGSGGLPDNTLKVRFTGTAGQSFGAFLAKGVTFLLEGETNDYLAKGLSGGIIAVYPERKAVFRARNNIIAGNVCLFGATGGEVYIRGLAGERFAVRNSGALAVVEGVGDHGCEYMTGGCVVVLGRTGVNFAAGMSGGIAYVMDEDQLFDTRCNLEMVDLEPVSLKADRDKLASLIKKHADITGSRYALEVLKYRDEMLAKFVKVIPSDYRKALERIREASPAASDRPGMTEEVY